MKKYIGFGIILFGLIGFYFFNQPQEKEEPFLYQAYAIENTETFENEGGIYYVEIKGEVRFPGVYKIGEDEILKQLIDKAGGLTENADMSGINQAQLVVKNFLYIIPKVIKEEFKLPVTSTTTMIEKTKVYVDIKGEVINPGVYLVEEGSRILDVIELAGGLTVKADIRNVNRSDLVYDGMMIIIPSLPDEESMYAYIGGAVINPGYYELEIDLLLSDLIIEAGGITDTADMTMINLNQPINNGDVIIIPEIVIIPKIYVSVKGEVLNPDVYYVNQDITIIELINLAGGLTPDANPSLIDYNQILVMGSIVNIPAYQTDDYQPIDNQNDLVNINTASLEELQTLKGIGEILGQRIIDYRIEYGYFASIEDIKLVSGIKDSIYEQIKDYITV
ncbi:MAG: SLBB domain-containing protein [Candidatus Izemoplasmatales bacterium]|nr:SLBB domain-containing protein [Candidatus Izemoplasmatales bacterium]